MKYQGSCHCQKVKFEAEIELKEVISCNCSICQRKGTLLTFVPESQFKLLSGEEVLKDYQFGPKKIHHLFCSNCGVTSFASSGETRAINVRCLDGIDLNQLSIKHFDGRSL